jgi:hypothetical protein
MEKKNLPLKTYFISEDLVGGTENASLSSECERKSCVNIGVYRGVFGCMI